MRGENVLFGNHSKLVRRESIDAESARILLGGYVRDCHISNDGSRWISPEAGGRPGAILPVAAGKPTRYRGNES